MNQESPAAPPAAAVGPGPIRWPCGLLLLFFLGACVGTDELEQPVPLYGDQPIEYPLDLWDEGVEGDLLLRVRVNETGAVDSVEVTESSGHQALDSVAVAGAWDLRFEPGRRNGQRTRMWATLPVTFSKRPQPAGEH